MTRRPLRSSAADPWLARPPRAQVPARLRPWLTDAGSLTARIRARCDDFRVEVVRQARVRPQVDEARALGLPLRQAVWLREVMLVADGVPVVYARSVLPARALRGPWHLCRGIGARPLGAALFSDPRVARGPLHCARLDRRDARYHRAVRALGSRLALPPALWARRSVFERQARALLVSEIFLPTLLDLAP